MTKNSALGNSTTAKLTCFIPLIQQFICFFHKTTTCRTFNYFIVKFYVLESPENELSCTLQQPCFFVFKDLGYLGRFCIPAIHCNCKCWRQPERKKKLAKNSKRTSSAKETTKLSKLSRMTVLALTPSLNRDISCVTDQEDLSVFFPHPKIRNKI